MTYFSAGSFDTVLDLGGDPAACDLAVFFAGNQFMVVPTLIDAFVAQHDAVSSVFYETLPPGIVADQVRTGRLQVNDLVISTPPDVVALSPTTLLELRDEGLVGCANAYASNDLALLVQRGNPLAITGWEDLAAPGIRVAFPNPATEGIGALAAETIERVGGLRLRERIMADKHASGDTILTDIHHRQGPAWLAEDRVDVAVVWTTEATWHTSRGEGFTAITLDPAEQGEGHYACAAATKSTHPDLAEAFVAFMTSTQAQALYRSHGFSTLS
ncbi:extracellular solute-binding protein [Knoellia koreensis]|uniref:Substrate-binding domain-containing protein n=1 Tax=Knoellia koreensis TaxID=2730921 RepID=A0A849HAU9_9MICO|nr:substrate-binding domain-containing protein [Knoellia sp. DB2414S]